MHEISEANHRILNPITDEKLMLLGQVSRVGPGTRMLDLCCGKGEMLCRWADEFGVGGLGVDISEVFLPAARRRAEELNVADRVGFVQGDAGAYRADERYDVVACIGATWIGGGPGGTVELMRKAVKPDGLLLVGEPYWISPPPEAAYEAMGLGRDEWVSLAGTAERFAAVGADLVEMVLANRDSWDRYAAGQWWTCTEWLRANPDDARAAEVREFRDGARASYLAYGRDHVGWGVFVLRP